MEERRRKARKRRKVNVKRIIPILVAIVLIVVVVAVFYGDKLISKYSYSEEHADMNEYFNIYSEDDVAIVLHDTKTDYHALMHNGSCYFGMDMVRDLFVDRFYVNEIEGTVSFTDATQVTTAYIGDEYTSFNIGEETVDFGSPIVIKKDEQLYMNVEYVKKYANFSYTLYENPNRMVLNTSWEAKTAAYITKNTAIRKQGGVKSPILKDMVVGDKVYILETMETWSEVATTDGIIGYVENKRLDNRSVEEQTPVTDVIPFSIAGLSRDYTINMAFFQVFKQSGNDNFDSYLSGVSGINVLAPTWFRLLDSEGNIESIAEAAYVNKAHERGMEVWAVLTDVDTEVELFPLFSSSQRRKALISNLISTCEQNGIDGINVDIEKVSADTGEHFIQFIRELSIETRAKNMVLSIDNYAPTASTAHYNRAEQGVYADYVVVMGYDEHWGGGGVAGSVASLGFVEKGIQDTILEVPSSKVINAIPFYTRLWKTSGGTVTSEALGMDKAKEVVSNAGAEVRWDDVACQNYAEFTSGDDFYQIWMEDEESLKAKLNVMRVNKVAGVAEWKLGFENSSVWPLLTDYVNTPSN